MTGNLITKTLDFRVKWPTVAPLSSLFKLFYGTNDQIQSYVLLVTYYVLSELSSISPQDIKDTSDITFYNKTFQKYMERHVNIYACFMFSL